MLTTARSFLKPSIGSNNSLTQLSPSKRRRTTSRFEGKLPSRMIARGHARTVHGL
jgi:hypothetical protein